MQWNNMYLIPFVLIGGLLAFFFGRTIFGGIKRLFSRVAFPAPVVSPAKELPVIAQEMTVQPTFPMNARYARRSLADRKEALAVELMAAEDEQDALARKLKEQDEEEARRIRLVEEYRKRSRSNNVLVGKLDSSPSAGPLTRHIALSEELLAELKAAKALKESASPN